MKPTLTFPTTHKRADRSAATACALPHVHAAYQPPASPDFARYGSDQPSFRRISEGYFGTEARQDFIIEAALFAVIVTTAAVPIINGARVVLSLAQAFSGV